MSGLEPYKIKPTGRVYRLYEACEYQEWFSRNAPTGQIIRWVNIDTGEEVAIGTNNSHRIQSKKTR